MKEQTFLSGISEYGNFSIPEKKIFETRSKFQKIEIIENNFFGRVLKLDNALQTSEEDEFLYHEPLVHSPMFLSKAPKRVLIIGGGDGGALEEISKYSELDEIVLVEIDKEVIRVSKEYLKKINEDSFKDPRSKIVIADGFDFLRKNSIKFDIIILDLTDPSRDSIKLYSNEFYCMLSNNLNKEGILSLHAESYFSSRSIFLEIISNLRSSFREVHVFSHFVPLYGDLMAFVMCSNAHLFCQNKDDLINRFNSRNIPNLKYFSPEIFSSSSVLPKYINDLLFSYKQEKNY